MPSGCPSDRVGSSQLWKSACSTNHMLLRVSIRLSGLPNMLESGRFLYGMYVRKFGITAVMRRAEAVRHACIIINNSMRPSLMSPGAVDWKMKTAAGSGRSAGCVLSFVLEHKLAILISHGFAYCHTGFVVRIIQTHSLCSLSP